MNPTRSTPVLRGVPLGPTVLRLAVKLAPPVTPPAATPLHAPPSEAATAAAAAGEGFDRGRADGYREGLAAGREEGLHKGMAQAAQQAREAAEQAVIDATRALRDAQDQLDRLLLGLQPAFAACVAAAEDEMVALCYETICSVLGKHALQREVVQGHARHVLSLAGRGQSVALHLHPQDAEMLASCALGMEGVAAAMPIRCVPDLEVELGGCIVRGQAGGLDARLETALHACKEALVCARMNHQRLVHAKVEVSV